MKIYIIPVKSEFQPETSKLIYPLNNEYIGVERVFYNWLKKQREIVTENVEEADWFYLPIFWTNYLFNHNYGRDGLDKLEDECRNVIFDSEKTFTLCQYDNGPIVDLKSTLCFQGSREKKDDLDIPLLCSAHQFTERKKKYIASFVGRIETHPIRKELLKAAKGKKNFWVLRGHWRLGEKLFVYSIEKSYACLCPRGNGGGSFRFYEAMQMGVVPVHIGDNDVRPFKKYIDWNKCSFYFEDPYVAIQSLEKCSIEKLVEMGKRASEFYRDYFSNDNWCKFVVKELEDVRR